MLAYTLLGLAIISEAIGSTFLVKSEDFSKLASSLLVFVFYVISFFYYRKCLRPFHWASPMRSGVV